MNEKIEVTEYTDQAGVKTKQVNKTVSSTAKAGISFGSCLAMVISYSALHSIPWAILHGILGWIYVIYYVIKY